MMLRPYRVAVYGTLKRNQSNHGVLAGSRFVGACSLSSIVLYDLGPYPGARLQPSQGVEVEVYDVDGATFARLDELEDYDAASPGKGLYDRRLLETPLGKAWVYLYNHAVTGCQEIRSGAWPKDVSCVPLWTGLVSSLTTREPVFCGELKQVSCRGRGNSR